jgi:hypothetical protein
MGIGESINRADPLRDNNERDDTKLNPIVKIVIGEAKEAKL